MVYPLNLIVHPSGTSLVVHEKYLGDVPNPVSFGRGPHNLSMLTNAFVHNAPITKEAFEHTRDVKRGANSSGFNILWTSM